MAFREVVGHRRLLSLLARAIANDTLTPSLILSGPEGVGKRLTAISIAQELNCTNRQPLTTEHGPGAACGVCPSCRRIARGAYPDVLLIEPGEMGSIKVEQVRAAIEAAVYRPFEGRRRVTIIDDADALVPAAQNAMLKTLEEPPAASVFILVTDRPDVLLPTVRSRCAQLRFGRLQISDVAEVLESRHGYSRSDALAAAAASDGSVRRALDIDAGEFTDARNDAELLLRSAGRDVRRRLENGRQLLSGSSRAASEREYLSARLEALTSLLRDVGLLTSGADAGMLANDDCRGVLETLSRSASIESLARSFAAVAEAQEALDRNVGPKVVADWLAVHV